MRQGFQEGFVHGFEVEERLLSVTVPAQAGGGVINDR